MADLSRVLLIERVRGMCAARRSGVLVATQGEVSKGLFLRAGRVVFASSTVEKEKLGENLIRLGRISRADFVAAYRASQTPRRRLGQALVGAGLITEEELAKLVSLQVQKIVVSVLAWTAGATRFHEAADPIPADLALDLSTHRLLLEGARVFPDLDRLEKALGPLDRTLGVSRRPPFEFASMPFAPAEREVLNGAADGLSPKQILAQSKVARPLLVRAVYALRVGGILEETGQGEVPYEADTGTFRLALPESRPAPQAAAVPPAPGHDSAAALRERILRLYEAVPRATHYEILEVPPDATREQVETANVRLSREQDREWQPLTSDLRLASLISTLRLRRRQAYTVLSDPQRRAAYDRSLGALRPSAQPAASTSEESVAPRMVREAERLVADGKRDLAVALLLEAVRVDPQHRPCRRLLALALAEDPALSKAAERHFLAALDLDPTDTDLRYGLAKYYRKLGLQDRAVAELKAVLAAEPRHPGAARALREMGQS